VNCYVVDARGAEVYESENTCWRHFAYRVEAGQVSMMI